MTTHTVKSWSYLFQAIKLGMKKHDIRDTRDRNYNIGDTIILREFDQTKGMYTGDELTCSITYITDRNTPCAFSSSVLDRDFCILTIQPIND